MKVLGVDRVIETVVVIIGVIRLSLAATALQQQLDACVQSHHTRRSLP
jgi:hypothetical protein